MKTIQAIWKRGPVEGVIEVAHGALVSLTITRGKGWVKGASFAIRSGDEARLRVGIADARVGRGSLTTRVTVRTRKHPFTLFLRDVTRECPIFIAEYGVIVTVANEPRTYAAIEAAIRGKGLASQLTAIEDAPEETYEDACARNRDSACPTWLGLSRDMRMFRLNHQQALYGGADGGNYGFWGLVDPYYHSMKATLPETDNKPYGFCFAIGPGAACRVKIERRLEEGCLPILRSEQHEDDITYRLTAFATGEIRPLRYGTVRGSDGRAVYPNTAGHMLTAQELTGLKDLLDGEMKGREDEVVCCIRVEAVNRSQVPWYAWFRGVLMATPALVKTHAFVGRWGFSVAGPDRVYAVHRLDGRPMPDEEMAVLVQPGQTTVFDMLIPHQPISEARAKRLAKLDVERHLEACRRFWRRKLVEGARIRVPERAIDERLRAGLLHCDLVALGKEPDGAVLATIGPYSPIGSESAPIIQFFDSMGWHRLAERSLDFFLERQRADGFIQNFGGYQLETGPVLWTLGEHYRYTRDDAWVRRIKPRLLKACEFLLAWRNRNKRPELRGRGYGLLDGKVADPEDFFHSFMLNGVSHLGIQRVAEMLAKIAPAESRRLQRENTAFRDDIRRAFYESLARSPAIPLSDGTWIPSVPPWSDYPGPLALYAEGGKWWSHAAFGARDSLCGALYLVISEVLEPNEIGTDFLLRMHQQLFTAENAGFSQPYYCRHDYIHMARGEVKPFLKTYYNQMTALQDRETYTFWEHYHFGGSHKTHEEGWFLMQTRWMLWFEQGTTLNLLRAVPRRWLADGKTIRLDKVASHFGPLTVKVESREGASRIAAHVVCDGHRKPKAVTVRLPHPDGHRATRVEGGEYDAKNETVRIAPFRGQAHVALYF